MQTAIALVNLFNAATPGIASLIAMIRREDGTVAIVVMLDEADAQFSANLQQAKEWLAAHPKQQ